MKLVKQSLLILFHPVDSFVFLKKNRGIKDYTPIFVLLALVFILRIISIFSEHFALAAIDPKDANIWMELIRMILPIFLTAVSCYAVTTITDGETLFKETLLATCYSMLPYIVFVIPLSLLSHIMHKGDSAIYQNLNAIIWIWVGILFFISIKTMNEYSFSKTVGIMFLTLVTMTIIVIIGLLFFALTSQVTDFVSGVLLELKMYTTR